jgi:hypothetical protein
MGEGACDVEIATDLGGVDQIVEPALVDSQTLTNGAGAEVGDERCNDVDFGSFDQYPPLQREPIRVTDIVGIHPGNQISTTERKAAIERRHQSEVLLSEHPQTGVASGPALQNLARAVHGAVVDGHYLEVIQGLGSQRSETLLEIEARIVDRQEDGNAAGRVNACFCHLSPRGESTPVG